MEKNEFLPVNVKNVSYHLDKMVEIDNFLVNISLII